MTKPAKSSSPDFINHSFLLLQSLSFVYILYPASPRYILIDTSLAFHILLNTSTPHVFYMLLYKLTCAHFNFPVYYIYVDICVISSSFVNTTLCPGLKIMSTPLCSMILSVPRLIYFKQA